MRNKRGRLILMGLLSLLVVGGTIGGALAEEMRPYKAPELRLEQGADEYDLMEGITYRSDHYELDLVDTGDFDIDIPGGQCPAYLRIRGNILHRYAHDRHRGREHCRNIAPKR